MTEPGPDLLDLDALEPVALEEVDGTDVVGPPDDWDPEAHADEPDQPGSPA